MAGEVQTRHYWTVLDLLKWAGAGSSRVMLVDEVHGDGILFFRHTAFLLEIVHNLCDCCRTLQIVEAVHLRCSPDGILRLRWRINRCWTPEYGSSLSESDRTRAIMNIFPGSCLFNNNHRPRMDKCLHEENSCLKENHLERVDAADYLSTWGGGIPT
jgi:hypothetical protein